MVFISLEGTIKNCSWSRRKCAGVCTFPLQRHGRSTSRVVFFSVPSRPVFANKANEMVDVNEQGRISRTIDVFLRVAVVDPCVTVIMKLLERARAWSSERLKDMPDFDPRMIKYGRGVLLPLPPAVIERGRCVGVRRIVSGTCHGTARAPAAVVCACAINWTRPDVSGWYSHDFSTGDVYAVPLHRSKQGKTCPGLVSHVRIRPVNLEGENRMRAALEKSHRKTALAAAEERRSWDRALKARKKRPNMSPDENVQVARENVPQKAAAGKSGQEGLVVEIGDCLLSALEAAAGATLADVS